MNIRIFEAFAGYGSQALALKRLARQRPGLTFTSVGYAEIDRHAIKAYKALHGDDITNYGDIAKIDWSQVPDFDLFTYSFPCGLRGTKVKTDNGYKNIEDMAEGDLVLTYKNRYCRVSKTMSRTAPSHFRIKATGCDLRLTDEHPLWVLRDGKQMWVKVKDLTRNDKLSYCISQTETRVKLSDSYLWLLGRYAADGFVNKRLYNSVEFAIALHKENEFMANIPVEMGSRFKKFKKSCWEYRIADAELQSHCLEIGNGSTNKRVPEWIVNAPKDQVKHFLAGYFSGDGHVRYRGGGMNQMFTTVSKDLFLGIQMLLLKVYGKVCSLNVRQDERKETFNDTYNGQICFCDTPAQQVIGDKIFVPIKSIEEILGDVEVFNLSVEDDESYTCDNVNTHNCQDISVAGKQRGLTQDSGTRSSLLWECERAIAAKRPRFLLMENVKALTQKKFMPDLKRWIAALEGYGYANFWQVLNAKHYGVPQNRERVFMVSILRSDSQPEPQYAFPQPFPLERRLKHVLEPAGTVPESYYISNEKAAAIIAHCEKKLAEGCGFAPNFKSADDICTTITGHYGNRETDTLFTEAGTPPKVTRR